MTLRDVLQLPVLQLSSVPTHREIEEDREVTSVSVQEIPVGKFIRPGELVLSTGMNVGKDARRLARFVRDVAQSRRLGAGPGHRAAYAAHSAARPSTRPITPACR